MTLGSQEWPQHCVSLCRAQDPRTPFTESLGLGSHCAFLFWTESAPGILPSGHSSVTSAPGSTVGTHKAMLSFALFGFLCTSGVCCGTSLQALLVAPFTPAARVFGNLHLQHSGVLIHGLAVPACCLETFMGTAHPPLTCASGSGGTPAPQACSGCGRGLCSGWM